jgi:hypothetical protein
METNSCQNNPGPKFYSSSSSKEHQRPFWQKNFPSFVGPKGFLSSHKLYCTKSINGNYTKPLLYIDDAHRFLTIYISHHHMQGPRALIKKILGLRRGMEKIYIITNVKNTQHYQPIMINNLEDDFYLLVAQFTTGERETNRLLQPGSRTCSLTISRPSNCA